MRISTLSIHYCINVHYNYPTQKHDNFALKAYIMSINSFRINSSHPSHKKYNAQLTKLINHAINREIQLIIITKTIIHRDRKETAFTN